MTKVSRKFPIVGIGASAGGVEAIEGFFLGLPPHPGMAFVIVTHLSPRHESVLPAIVSRFTPLTVLAAADGMAIEPDHVYVMPEASVLRVKSERLVVQKLLDRSERKPVDIFFSELAAEFGERSAGVVLSGGDADGTLGLKAIKEQGGLTFAQVGDGHGPRTPDMPDTAISAGFVDFALPVDEMGPKLVELARSETLLQEIVSWAESGGTEGGDFNEALPSIYAVLRNQVGHDFSGYKRRTFIRRIQRRMQIQQVDDICDYVRLLESDTEEVAMLFRDLLINVTSFFRDREAFDSLATFVIPRLLEERDQNDTIRIWVPGCATGEEVYSIAILLQEHMAKTSVSPRVQIFASDIDERALAVARTGHYPEALLDNVSQARRERFFVRDGASYVICKQIRDQCIFSAHSVMRDPPFSRIDLVSCRNLLIYFGPEVQARVLPTFHYALKPDGYLFLGAAENVTQFDELFAPVQKHHRLFRRRSVPTPHLPFTATGAPLASPLQDRPTRRTNAIASEFRQAVDAHVLQHFAPAHVVVNGEGEIVFFSARTGKYLEMPIGTPTRHLLTLARRDIRLDLQTMLREVTDTRRPAHRERVAVDMGNGTVQMMSLMAEPFNGKHDAEPLYIVAFNDQGPILSREEAIARLSESQAGASLQTERDLRDTRERLQSLIEEYETALEELKSSNEELVSVNEELQSTNEELEASKEELQSLNEELHTVNAELNGKVDALDRANSDLVNLFQATDVATVFLDKKLVIRSFTPAVSNVLNIRPGDVGRPVTDLSSRATLDGLSDDIRNVFENGQIVERRAKGGSPMVHYLVRIAPYMDSAMLSEGVVITFLDVTTLVMSEERHHMLVAELQHRTRNMLGMVQAIALRTLTDGTQLESFLERLEAIGRTQSLLGRASTEQLRLSDLLQQELDALPNSAGRVRVSGPDVMLDFESAQTLGLALHELATNAVKHGALGVEGGRIDVSWKTPDSPEGGAIMLEWREHGVEMLAPPERMGFGRELIEKALTHTLQARTQLLFEPDGVVCRIILPSVAQRISAMSSPDHAHA